MALPLVLGAVGLGLAQSFGQAAQAKAAQEHQEKQFQAIKANALAAFATQASQVRSRTQQERTQIAEEVANLFRETVQRSGRISNVAGASNVGGLSVTEAHLEVERASANQRRRLNELQEFREVAADYELAALSQRTEGLILGALPGPDTTPTLFGTLLGGVAGGLSIASAFSQLGPLFGPDPAAAAPLIGPPAPPFIGPPTPSFIGPPTPSFIGPPTPSFIGPPVP